MNTISEAIKIIRTSLKDHTESPQIDAELLVAHSLRKSRTYLYSYPEQKIACNDIENLKRLLQRRHLGEPVAYILGTQAFWTFELEVTPDTLIPRPETEHLIEWILNRFDNSPRIVADLGTGSGAIAIALALERPNWTIHATDSSINALKIAEKNARRLNLNNIEFYVGDWCNALPNQHYQLVVSNPPYIAEDDAHLDKLRFEPRQALSSGDLGLDAITTIAKHAHNYLQPESALILEHGYDQAELIKKILTSFNYRDIQSHQDLSAHDRFVTCYI